MTTFWMFTLYGIYLSLSMLFKYPIAMAAVSSAIFIITARALLALEDDYKNEFDVSG